MLLAWIFPLFNDALKRWPMGVKFVLRRVNGARLTRPTFVSYSAWMGELQRIREELASRHGEWTKIAAAAGLSRKTLGRVVANADYMPNVRTLFRIQSGLASVRQKATES